MYVIKKNSYFIKTKSSLLNRIHPKMPAKEDRHYTEGKIIRFGQESGKKLGSHAMHFGQESGKKPPKFAIKSPKQKFVRLRKLQRWVRAEKFLLKYQFWAQEKSALKVCSMNICIFQDLSNYRIPSIYDYMQIHIHFLFLYTYFNPFNLEPFS